MLQAGRLSDKALRGVGLSSMIIGVLYIEISYIYFFQFNLTYYTRDTIYIQQYMKNFFKNLKGLSFNHYSFYIIVLWKNAILEFNANTLFMVTESCVLKVHVMKSVTLSKLFFLKK